MAALAGGAVSFLHPSLETVLISAIALSLILPVLVRAALNGFDPFEPCFLFAVAYGVMFVARPAAIWSSHDFSADISGVGVDFRATFAKMLVLALVGALGFGVGYLGVGGRRLAEALRPPPSQTDERSLLRLANAFALVGCLLFGLFLASNGAGSTISLLFAGRSLALTHAYYSSSSYFSYGLLLLVPAILITLTLGLKNRRPRVIIVALFWLAIYLAVEISLGDRIALLPLFGGLLIYRYLAAGRRPQLLALLLAGAVAVFASAVLVGARTAQLHKPSFVARATQLWQHPGRLLDPILKGGDGAEAPNLAAALTVVPARIGYTWGGSTLGDLITRPIPRSLWPAKPLIPRGRVATLLWGRYYYEGVANPEFSVLLYPYMDGGFPGVFLMMIAFGVIARSAYEYLRRYSTAFSVALTYSVGLPMLVMAVRDSPVDILARSAFFVFPVWLAFRWSRRVPASRLAVTGLPTT